MTYQRNGTRWLSRCPACTSADLEPEEPEVDRNEITQSVSCCDCGVTFIRLYAYEGYQISD